MTQRKGNGYVISDQVSCWPAALAALSGLVAVAMGAFGAHGVSDPRLKGWLETGGHYQLIHALAALAALWVASRGGGTTATVAAWLFLAGGLLFAGSLYGMAFTGARWLGPVTPVGGLLLMAGWLALGWAALRAPAA